MPSGPAFGVKPGVCSLLSPERQDNGSLLRLPFGRPGPPRFPIKNRPPSALLCSTVSMDFLPMIASSIRHPTWSGDILDINRAASVVSRHAISPQCFVQETVQSISDSDLIVTHFPI